jgi:hypothetical protein
MPLRGRPSVHHEKAQAVSYRAMYVFRRDKKAVSKAVK